MRLRDQREQLIFSADPVAVLEGPQQELGRYALWIRHRANIALGNWYRGAFSVFYFKLAGVAKRRGLDLPRPCGCEKWPDVSFVAMTCAPQDQDPGSTLACRRYKKCFEN
jgi:hypothetical protein